MRVYKVAVIYYSSCVWTHVAYFCLLGREGNRERERRGPRGRGGQRGSKDQGEGLGGGVGSGFPLAPLLGTCFYRFYLLVPKHLTIC